VTTPHLLLVTLDAALNRWLVLDPDTALRLEALDGKVAELHLRGLDFRCFVLADQAGIQVRSTYQGEPDALISATPLTLLAAPLAVRTGESNDYPTGDVEISGDVAVGEKFTALLNVLAIDWEEPLSRLVGDFAARRLGNSARALQQWLKRSGNSLEQDLGEYLKEEIRLLPAPVELAKYCADVDALQRRVERIQARLQRLLDRHAPPP
jgi:ubiquinone biosynthesis protein UbiJ